MAANRWGEGDQTICQVNHGLHGSRSLEATGTANLSRAEGQFKLRGEICQAFGWGERAAGQRRS